MKYKWFDVIDANSYSDVLKDTGNMVEAIGNIEAKCCKKSCWIRNRSVDWVWHDEMDATNIVKLRKNQTIGFF